MSPTHESPARREARCEATRRLFELSDEQLDDLRMHGESREGYRDRVLKIAQRHPFEALAWMGA